MLTLIMLSSSVGGEGWRFKLCSAWFISLSLPAGIREQAPVGYITLQQLLASLIPERTQSYSQTTALASFCVMCLNKQRDWNVQQVSALPKWNLTLQRDAEMRFCGVTGYSTLASTLEVSAGWSQAAIRVREVAQRYRKDGIKEGSSWLNSAMQGQFKSSSLNTCLQE